MTNKLCEECGKSFSVPRSRATTAKYCCTTCRDKGRVAAPNQTCSTCSKPFHMKQSQIDRYARNLGLFCSHACSAVAKASAYAGEKNPNYKARNTDQDGYRLYTPQASFLLGLKRMKLHQAVCCEALGILKMPKDVHIHHRDCDIQNNAAENLAVLSTSDHKWLHKQYGIATLWAYCHNKITLDLLVEWSDDREKALRLLPLNVRMQTKESIITKETNAD